MKQLISLPVLFYFQQEKKKESNMLDIDENSQNILNKIKDTSSQLPEGTARASVFFIVVFSPIFSTFVASFLRNCA